MSDWLAPVVGYIGLWGTHSQVFLLVVMCFTTLAFALPIFLMPLTWARWMKWRLPREADGHDLAVYFGRCLGAFVLIVEGLMLRSILTGDGLLFTFQVMIAVAFFMVIRLDRTVRRVRPGRRTSRSPAFR